MTTVLVLIATLVVACVVVALALRRLPVGSWFLRLAMRSPALRRRVLARVDSTHVEEALSRDPEAIAEMTGLSSDDPALRLAVERLRSLSAEDRDRVLASALAGEDPSPHLLSAATPRPSAATQRRKAVARARRKAAKRQRRR